MKGFGVASSQKLRLLEINNKIRHEDIYYGTINSFKTELSSKKQATIAKPSRVGVLEYFDRKAERKRLEKEKNEGENLKLKA